MDEFERADVVVAGAGAAGAALAARLSEDPDRKVLLLEAGPLEVGPELLDARLVPGAQPGNPATVTYQVRLTPDRPWGVPRGRIAGGSTTVNGGYFIRAPRADFDRWAAAGNPAWAYGKVLPLLRRLETDLDYPAGELHGHDGPMLVRRTDLDQPAAKAFRDAAKDFPFEPDKNDDGEPGFGAVPCNVEDGIRRNTALSYLTAEVRARPNLIVLGGRRVTRVVIENGRATGVALGSAVIRAHEVVLSAGAFATAQLLLLSGIGPRADLERLHIPVVRDAAAVGTRFSDHPQVIVEWPQPADFGLSWLGGCLHLNSSDADGPGNLEILQSLVPLSTLAGGTGGRPAFLVADQTPSPTGTLRLRSADPDDPPVIDYGYLSAPGSLRRLREAVQVAASIAGAAVDDEWIRDHLGTSQHTCGTAPMGDDPATSVADQYGRVHGVPGLRIADTSLLPDAPHRGPANTAVLIGELIADAMRAPA